VSAVQAAAGGNANEVGLALVGASGAGLAWSRRRRS
jgi:MYXO-CTERM domain-containing protein